MEDDPRYRNVRAIAMALAKEINRLKLNGLEASFKFRNENEYILFASSRWPVKDGGPIFNITTINMTGDAPGPECDCCGGSGVKLIW